MRVWCWMNCTQGSFRAARNDRSTQAIEPEQAEAFFAWM